MPKGKRNEKVIGQTEAIEFQKKRRREGDVVAWNITRGADRFIARPKCSMPWAPSLKLEATTLEGLREKLPPGLVHFPGDEITLEVWI